jgi:hypothetical protein
MYFNYFAICNCKLPHLVIAIRRLGEKQSRQLEAAIHGKASLAELMIEPKGPTLEAAPTGSLGFCSTQKPYQLPTLPAQKHNFLFRRELSPTSLRGYSP